MRLGDTRPSTNFVDETSWSPAHKMINTAATLLNPLSAVSNLRLLMQDKGLLAPTPITQLGMPAVTLPPITGAQ